MRNCDNGYYIVEAGMEIKIIRIVGEFVFSFDGKFSNKNDRNVNSFYTVIEKITYNGME